MELDKRILALRTEKGYTQARLAEMLGVSMAAVSKWECERAYPDITMLPKIAEVFNVSVDYLLGYDIASSKTIPEVVSEANRLLNESKGDEAEKLLRKTLARYPNNMQLTFELARHRFAAAGGKKRAEREKLLSKAAEGFLFVAERDGNKARRDWSLHYLTTISLMKRDYEKASEYNGGLLCAKGLYPRATDAIIGLRKSRDENALHALKEGVYGCIFEFSLLLPWITAYYAEAGDYNAVIAENLRAAKVYEAFADCGWVYAELSRCYESLALAYANKKEYDMCLYYLEKACESAVKYDGPEIDAAYKVCDAQNGSNFEGIIKASESMLRALVSAEREIYAPVRETARYKAIVEKLKFAAK